MGSTMTVDQFVANAYLLATGKTTALSFGSSKYTKILNLGNLFVRQWALEPGVNWNSLRSLFTLGAIVTATDTFALPATMGKISDQEGDFVRILHTDGVSESEYTIVPADRLWNDGPTLNNPVSRRNAWGTCAVIGSNLVFSTPFKTTNAQYGGTIKVPGYTIPATMTAISDVLPVDDPDWLCYVVAGEYDRNDVTRVQLYASLNDRATQLMKNMKAQNGSQVEEVYRGSWAPLGQTW